MAVSIISLIYTVAALFVLQKIGQLAVRYIKTLAIARRVPALPGTELIRGDVRFETFQQLYEFTLDHVQRTHVKLYRIWISFFYPFFSMTHPDTVKPLFTSSEHSYKTDFFGNAYTMLKPWIGNGILAHGGGWKWERNRRLLTPAFHFEILKNYACVFNDVAEELVLHLSKEERGKSIEICKPVTMATLDALLRCAFSYKGNIQELGTSHPYMEAVHRLSMLYVARLNNPALYPELIYRCTREGREFFSLCDYVHKFAEDIIAKRREALTSPQADETASKRHPDFLDILLKARDENGEGLSDEEIRAEADTFLFAGHDTTSSAISFGFLALAKYPEEQEKVYQEVCEVVGQGKVEWEHLTKLKYLQSFIKEVMRMYSTVPLIGRTLEEPMTVEGVTLPKGASIEININAINHRSDVWPDHEVFRPTRFTEHNPDRDPFSFVPFSAGSRNCIGQNFALNEQKVVLARLVQSFRLEVDASHNVELSPAMVMRAKHGIKVFLHPR